MLRVALAAVLAVVGALATSAGASAAPLGLGSCQTVEGVYRCDGLVTTWDGVPLDTTVTLPSSSATNLPLVAEIHGFGNSKYEYLDPASRAYTDNAYGWAKAGYAVLTYTARGLWGSCGTPDARLANAAACLSGYIHLADTRYEVRDTQELIGRLVDEGVADPARIGVTGDSYGGGQSFALAAASVCGFLLLVLIDNFTYTVFGFGIARSNEMYRVAYTMLLCLLAAIAGWKFYEWVSMVFRRPRVIPVAIGIAAIVLCASPWVTSRRLPRDPDASVLPSLQRAKTASSRPNILFLGADGLDASILSAYGYSRPTTPFLESISEDTLFFENAFSNAARTHGSLVTLLTGRSPFTTHVTFPPTVLQGEDSNRTLPVLLKALGYTTLQIGMRHYADAEDTNVRGFDAANYRWQSLEEVDPDAPPADETDVFRAAVAERIDERLGRLLAMSPAGDTFAHVEGRQVVPQWRDERRVTTLVRYFEHAPEPWFVHLHLLDTHCCQWVPDRTHFSGGPSPDIDARDSQVRETDDNIRRLVDALESTGRLERHDHRDQLGSRVAVEDHGTCAAHDPIPQRGREGSGRCERPDRRRRADDAVVSGRRNPRLDGRSVSSAGDRTISEPPDFRCVGRQAALRSLGTSTAA